MVSFFISKKTTFRSVFANNSVFNLHFMKVSTENDNNFGYEQITIVVDNIPLNNELPTPHLSFTALVITWMMYESRLPDAGTTYENVCNVIEYSSNKYFASWWYLL